MDIGVSVMESNTYVCRHGLSNREWAMKHVVLYNAHLLTDKQLFIFLATPTRYFLTIAQNFHDRNCKSFVLITCNVSESLSVAKLLRLGNTYFCLTF